MDSSSTIWDLLPNEISPPPLEDDLFWKQYARQCNNVSIHIAILSSDYLELILNRKKTIESRFSLYRRLPYKRVKVGDVVLLKRRSGPIIGVGRISRVWFFELENGTLNHIREKFGNQMQIDDEGFWRHCEELSYATLMKLDNVRRISPLKYSKRDRNAWVIFEPAKR